MVSREPREYQALWKNMYGKASTDSLEEQYPPKDKRKRSILEDYFEVSVQASEKI